MINKILLCAVSVMFIVSCSDGIETETKSDIETEVESNMTSDIVSDSDSEQLTDMQEKPSELSMPLEDYIDINSYSDRNYLTPLFLAQTTRVMSDEEKLSLMSAEYYTEQDQFKKSDLAKSILPKVNEEIESYAGDFGIKIPFGKISEPYNPYHSSYNEYYNMDTGVGDEKINITLQPYDFEKKQFPIQQCVNGSGFGIFSPRNSGNSYVANDQNIRLSFAAIAPEQFSYTTKEFVPNLLEYRYKNLDCALVVEDQEKAREIEGLRTNDEIDTKGYFYYKVTANENGLIAQPTYAKFTVYNITNGEDLATQELTWSKEDAL